MAGPPPDPRIVRRRYDRAAGCYAERAHLDAELAERLVDRTLFMNLEPRRVLDAGCGAGGRIGALARRFPGAEIWGADFSTGMLRAAKGAGIPSPLVAADLASLPFADGAFSAYWSNACLHLVPRHSAVFGEARRVLEDGGLFAFSSFGPDTLKELRAAFAAVDSHAHSCDFADMHALGDDLRRAGFDDPVMETEELVVLYSRPEDLVEELRKSGAANASAGARPSLMGRRAWGRFLDGYRASSRRDDGKVAATFELVLGHAWRRKGGPKEDNPGLRPIDFIRMR